MIQEYKPALVFLLKYLLVYLVLNSVYAWYVESCVLNADAITVTVTAHTAKALSFVSSDVDWQVVDGSKNVPIYKDGKPVIEVFEGCNSVNVMIVFVAFIMAFQGPFKLWLRFLLMGLVIIYVANIIRVAALFGVAIYFPDSLYFFHKFFFTGVIYMAVFVLWYFWVRAVKKKTAATSTE